MFRFIPALLAGFVAASAVNAQVDNTVAQRAASLTVQSGGKDHKVGDEIAKLDQMRGKVLAGITQKTEAQDYNLGAELKALDQLDRYSGRLADLVATQNPDAKDVVDWLQANAAAVGAWREAYTSTESFQDNSRLAELKAIEKRLGRKFTGDLEKEIAGLEATQDSAANSAAMEELGRRVRLASGLVSKQAGVIRLGLRMSPASVTVGDRVTLVVALAMGGGGAENEPVTLEVGVTGPTAFNLGTLHKQFASGASVGGQGWFSIATGDMPLPPGIYKVSVSATDTHGHSLTAQDTFEVKLPAIVPIAKAGELSPGVIAAFESLAKASGLPKLEFTRGGVLTGQAGINCSWQNAVAGGSELGRMSIAVWKPPTEGLAQWKKLPHAQMKTIDGQERLDISYTDDNGHPRSTLYWLNKDRTCEVSLMQFQAGGLADMVKRTQDMARKLDDAINKADEATK